jgi:UPF0755 protein
MSRRPYRGRLRILLSVLLAVTASTPLLIFVPGLNTARWDGGTAKVRIHRGSGFLRIVNELDRSGAVLFRWPVLVAGTAYPSLHRIKPGRYTIPPGLSTYQLLQFLHASPQDEVRLMIPNGVEQSRIAGIVAANLDIDSAAFMAATRDPRLLFSLGIRASSTEGYLFPGTYNFPWSSTPNEVISFLVGRFRSYCADSIGNADAGMGEHRLLTLASIVEAETPLDGEKPLIASVYLNRLKKKMRLQADPTVQFAIPGPARRLYYKDLEIESPYNTYRHAGMPPGPICNPGAPAIMAVLRPASTGYLYFVANGRGGHTFAPTLEAHARNIRNYRASIRDTTTELH